MDEKEIVVSKIVANSTPVSWAQAYTTLNFYAVVSLEVSQEEESITTLGKNVLEKLTREFFAQEEKNLTSIKQAVLNTIDAIDTNTIYSIVLATFSQNALYIVIAGEGKAVIKRGGKIGTVAQGIQNDVISFSGFLERNDIIILETNDFSKKISSKKILLLDHLTVSDIAESLAPLVHEKSRGTEAAIILKYEVHTPTILETQEEAGETQKTQSLIQRITPILSNYLTKLKPIIKKNVSGRLASNMLIRFKKKNFIIFCILGILTVVFLLSLLFEKKREQTKKTEFSAKEILSVATKKLEEADALATLNKPLAIETLYSAKTSLEEERKNTQNSQSISKINGMIEVLDKKLNELEGNTSAKNQIVFFDGARENIRNVSTFTKKGGSFAVLDKEGNIFLVSDSEKIEKKSKVDIKNVRFATSDDTFIYILGESGVYRIDKGNLKSTKIISIENISGYQGIDTFLGNVYLLNSSEKNVEKYLSPQFQKQSYFDKNTSFDKNTTFLSNPVSMTIDGSIWILEDSGIIRKFTKGKDDNFQVKGTTKTFSIDSLIYTETDFANLYILDIAAKKIAIIAKDGQYQGKIDIASFKENIYSFAIDKKSKKIFLLATNVLYMLDY